MKFVLVLLGPAFYGEQEYDSVDDANTARRDFEENGVRCYVEPREPDLRETVTRAVRGLADRRLRKIRWAGVAP